MSIFFFQVAVEELCQNLLISGPGLSMREMANKQIIIEKKMVIY